MSALPNNVRAQADERYKAENVRYCPHCGLQCLRTDGCDIVICGRDAEDKGHQIQYGKGCVHFLATAQRKRMSSTPPAAQHATQHDILLRRQ